MSDFAALNTALTGLIAHQRASEQIGHNIANVNTEGYSRTRLELTSAGAGLVGAVWATPRITGDGVKVAALLRIRDEFLERQALGDHGATEQLTASKQILANVERSFPEPGDNGLASQLSSFWSAWDDVANNPSSLGTRTSLLERATTVVQNLNRSATDLKTQRDSAVGNMSTIVQDVNSTLAEIAQLNGSIQDSVNAQLPANDLQDKRDLLIEKIAKLTGATTRDLPNGMMEVRVGGSALVSGTSFSGLTLPIQIANPTGDATLDAVGWKQVQIQANGYAVSFTGGQLAGLLDGVNRALPSYLDKLNQVATTLTSDVNSLHATAWGLNDAGATAPGRNFFALTPGVGAALGIRLTDSTDVPPGVKDQPANVAVSNGPGLLDASIAQKLAVLHDSTTGADSVYKSMIASLAVESQAVQQRSSIQDNITTQIDAQRKGASGVNLDEEMVNLTASQHAYAASAKLMTTISEMLDTLINLGR
jgi:flagellar hook-associated protein 1 FlgK